MIVVHLGTAGGTEQLNEYVRTISKHVMEWPRLRPRNGEN